MDTPLQKIKSEFGSKEALIEKLIPLLDRGADESEAEFRGRMIRVSNAKLLRLWAREKVLRDGFGSREALVDKIVELKFAGRNPDADFRRKILGFPTGKLLSIQSGLVRSAR